MLRFAALAATIALAGCSGKSEEPPAPTETTTAAATPAAAEQGVAPGTYDVKTADGTMSSTTINGDGTYITKDSKGDEVRGAYARHDGKDCFDPEGDAGENCWTVAPPAADGSFTATSFDGATTVTVTPQTAAPATSE